MPDIAQRQHMKEGGDTAKSLKLEAEKLPLAGIHLIEASAGTGKTFNITRIYLRLLLERRLKVQNILVVTFTKAATEELRGRIDAELRQTLNKWGRRDIDDAYYSRLESILSIEEASAILREALVNIDEAAIFTIHGFCKRVLSQQAFSSRLPFDLEMEVDSYDMKLEATRDWYRKLRQTPEEYLLISRYWVTPEEFVRTFSPLLVDELRVEFNSAESIEALFTLDCGRSLDVLKVNQAFIFDHLIVGHKDEGKRAEEFSALTDWLSGHNQQTMPKVASSVFDGKRYARKPADVKDTLNTIFTPIKQLKKQSESLLGQMERAKADEIVVGAIKSIVQEVRQRKQHLSSLDFDDLIIELLHSITGPQGESLVRNLLAQYPVALVDEFQDTDPNQYAVFKKIYKNSPRCSESSSDYQHALYMIGDPKQAIYGFRGGDVFAYLSARSDADMQWYMDTNWRSSSTLINAYNRLFFGNKVDLIVDEEGPTETTHVFKYGIGYIPVGSSKVKDDHFLADKVGPPLKYVYFDEDDNYGKTANNQAFRKVIADWCAREISLLLAGDTGERQLQENDIAILVRDRSEADDIQQALRAHGVTSVYLSTRENVFESNEAVELLRILTGILLAENDRLVIAALATRFMGFDNDALYRLQTDEVFWEECRLTFFTLRTEWQTKGIMSTFFGLIHKHYSPDEARHERSLTNTIHLLELLQHASLKHRQPWELLTWFREKVNTPAPDTTSELRLESDSNLIKIITLHGSKGLEYPVVFVPFATRAKSSGPKVPAHYRYHDERTQQAISLVGFSREVKTLSDNERYAEDVRLLYVAITRAEQLCYVCATPFADYDKSPLGLMLGLTKGDDLKNTLANVVADTPNDAQLLVASVGDDASDEYLSTGEPTATPVTVERFSGVIEDDWWVASFSAIVRHATVGSMANQDRDVEGLLTQISIDEHVEKQRSALRFVLTKGAMTGNLLHDILENVEFKDPDWKAAAKGPLLRFGLLEEQKYDDLYVWLADCLGTELFTGLSLGQLSTDQTLKETEFYFPTVDASRHQLSRLLRQHRDSPDDIQLPDGVKLNGMMHGFIDLIFEWNNRYYVVDYKSNYLGDTLDDYQKSKLTQNMQDHYYDLQYLIYTVALHRYLSLRVEHYHPDTHLGGVYYLYLRGMSLGNDSGIYHNKVPTDLIIELDQLFGRVG